MMRLWQYLATPVTALVAVVITLAPDNSRGAERAAPEAPSTFNERTGLYEPAFGDLERAVARRDRAEIGRWAARIGVSRLSAALRGTDHKAVRAALEAAIVLPGAAQLIDAVVPLLASEDASVSFLATQLLGVIVNAEVPLRLEQWDVPNDLLEQACTALASSAGRASNSIETRISAVEALSGAGGHCSTTSLFALMADPSPSIRRAAILGLGLDEPIDQQVLHGLVTDADAAVAAAGAVAVCRRLRAGRPPSTGGGAIGRTVATGGIAKDIDDQLAAIAQSLPRSPEAAPEDIAELDGCRLPSAL